jgi:polyhydroxyalkanoate synthesis repressor PhaR
VRIRIKRYANRKLYNTETSRYITLRGISDLLRQGRDVEVVDNETGHDISSLVFSRMLVDEERSAPALLESGAVLGEVVQRQLTSLYTLLRRYVGDMQDNLSGVRENVRRWVHTAAAPDDEPLRREIAQIQESLATLAAAVERIERRLAEPRGAERAH